MFQDKEIIEETDLVIQGPITEHSLQFVHGRMMKISFMRGKYDFNFT